MIILSAVSPDHKYAFKKIDFARVLKTNPKYGPHSCKYFVCPLSSQCLQHVKGEQSC